MLVQTCSMITVRQIAYEPLVDVLIEKQCEVHKFNLGDIVRWTSNRITKTGEVIAIIPPGGFLPPLDDDPEFSTRHIGFGGIRKDESYIIALPLGPKCKCRQCYWPLVTLLERI